jgi:hypothetical protein
MFVENKLLPVDESPSLQSRTDPFSLVPLTAINPMEQGKTECPAVSEKALIEQPPGPREAEPQHRHHYRHWRRR